MHRHSHHLPFLCLLLACAALLAGNLRAAEPVVAAPDSSAQTKVTLPAEPVDPKAHGQRERNQTEASAQPPATNQPSATPAANAAGFNLFRALTRNSAWLGKGGNLVLSPDSLETILHALLLGAKGDTAAELEKMLEAGKRVPRNVGSQADVSSSDPVVLREAAAFWLNKDWEARPEFTAALKADLRMEPRTADFSQDPAAATNQINGWVRETTAGRIEKLFVPADLGADTRLVLVSALAYDALWDTPFQEQFTKPGPFEGMQDGKPGTIQTDFMHQTGSFETAEAADGTQVLVLPLTRGSQRCVLLLPPPGKEPLHELTRLEQSLTPARYRELTSSLAERPVDLKLPRLNLTIRANVKAALEHLGVRSMFAARTADFSGMSAERGLCVSVLRHETRLELDEKGARGAAATGAALATRGLTSKPVVLVFDRPFVFAIEETSTGRLLFLGRLVTPTTELQ